MLALDTNYNTENTMLKALHRHEPPSFSFSLVRTQAYIKLTEPGVPPTKVTQIVAPTGYGKTVLMTALYNFSVSNGAISHWICLSESDDSSERVLARLEYFLDPQQTSRFHAEDMHKSDEPIEMRLQRIIDLFAQPKKPVYLFIDNLDYCQDETLSALIDALIFGSGPNFYLILASTRQPTISLYRAMLEGLVGNYGFEDLQEFSGADADLALMLNNQLLSGFEAEFREFLFAISLVKSFTVSLCQVLIDIDAADAYVNRLINNNLFIIPLSRNREEFRLHSLFREYLTGQALQHFGEDGRKRILLRASA